MGGDVVVTKADIADDDIPQPTEGMPIMCVGGSLDGKPVPWGGQWKIYAIFREPFSVRDMHLERTQEREVYVLEGDKWPGATRWVFAYQGNEPY